MLFSHLQEQCPSAQLCLQCIRKTKILPFLNRSWLCPRHTINGQSCSKYWERNMLTKNIIITWMKCDMYYSSRCHVLHDNCASFKTFMKSLYTINIYISLFSFLLFYWLVCLFPVCPGLNCIIASILPFEIKLRMKVSSICYNKGFWSLREEDISCLMA